MADANTTLVDSNADFDGRLKGKDAHVLGRFKGEIEVSGRIVLGEGSTVEAKVTADAAEVAGVFKGDLKARSVTLGEKARVEGNVDAQTLVVREGAQLNGAIIAGTRTPKPGGTGTSVAPAPAGASAPVETKPGAEVKTG
jgi:cytoskeletal protein CcmA (bactofilin family)